MTPNPFAPPRAEVADPKRAQPPPPPSVRNACLLIGAAFAIGVLTLLPGIRLPPPDEQPVLLLLITFGILLVFGGLTLWFAIRIFQGTNWARWAMFIYLLLGWVLIGAEFNDKLAGAPLLATIDAICIIMELIACWLLFFGAGARWFFELSAQRKAHPSGL